MACLTDTKDIASLLEYTKASRVGDKTNYCSLNLCSFKLGLSQQCPKEGEVVALRSGRSKYMYVRVYIYIC